MSTIGRFLRIAYARDLTDIFSKYCSPAPPPSTGMAHAPDDAFLNEAAVDRWAQDTNGAPFAQETKDELRECFDVTNEGHLTCVGSEHYMWHSSTHHACLSRFKGFLQLYALQTETDEEVRGRL